MIQVYFLLKHFNTNRGNIRKTVAVVCIIVFLITLDSLIWCTIFPIFHFLSQSWSSCFPLSCFCYFSFIVFMSIYVSITITYISTIASSCNYDTVPPYYFDSTYSPFPLFLPLLPPVISSTVSITILIVLFT